MFTKEEIDFYKDKATISPENQVKLLLDVLEEKNALILEHEARIQQLHNQLRRYDVKKQEQVKTDFEQGIRSFFTEHRGKMAQEALVNFMQPKAENLLVPGEAWRSTDDNRLPIKNHDLTVIAKDQ